MFELTVQRDFRATHAISMQGQLEQTHEHCWQVSVVVQGDRLDDDGLLCDFHLIDRELEGVIVSLRDRDLNRTPPFDQINPTAEHVARHIGEQLAGVLPPAVALKSVSVTEAPGCVARWVRE
jgi:6-pyruvoyltetrahydropterin/6-carboxytetrahydropterin synthase